MKYGILVCSPSSLSKNIGDYTQSVAQLSYLPRVDNYVEREHLNEYQSEEKTKVIMNGWFMFHPEKFPPSDDIDPLFVSLHLVPKIESAFFTPETIHYLKKYEPIGARDLNTERMLKKHGIQSYFSGCLTLTLGDRYKCNGNRENVIFVDPYYPIAGTKISLYNPFGYIKSFYFAFKYLEKAKKIKDFVVERKTIFRKISSSFEKIYSAANFYAYYSKSFSDEILFNAKYITHNIKVNPNQEKDRLNDEMIGLADALMQKYAKAQLVVTSRIHCGLPCLGVETPCIFITADILKTNSLRGSGRLDGLIELFNIAKLTPKGVVGVSPEMVEIFSRGKLSNPQVVPVRKEYLPLKEKLVERIKGFLNTECI